MVAHKYFDKGKAGFTHADPMLYGLLKQFSARMRRYPTPAEATMWEYLRGNQLGVPFRRQHVMLGYIADFVCLPAKLIIEIDGEIHDDWRQQIHDEFRTEDLERMGFTVIRFTNEQIYSDIETVIGIIKGKIK